MNMLLSPPKSPLWACVCLSPPCQGQGLPSKLSLAQVPKEAAVLHASWLHTVGTWLALPIYMWTWHDLEIRHLYWRAPGIKVTATPMPGLLEIVSASWTGGCIVCSSLNPNIFQQASGWTCETSPPPTFAWTAQKEVLVTLFRWNMSNVHLSNCAEGGGAVTTAPATRGNEGRVQALESLFWIWNLALPLPSCVTLQRLVNLSERWFLINCYLNT